MESRRVCVRAIIEKDGKLFAQRLKNSQNVAADYWCTPGGGVDSMESLHDALHREMIEETGVAPVIGRLLLVQQFGNGQVSNHGEIEQLEFFFEVTNASDYEAIDLESTTHGATEIAEYGFIDPAVENILPNILQTPEFMASLRDPSNPVAIFNELPS